MPRLSPNPEQRSRILAPFGPAFAVFAPKPAIALRTAKSGGAKSPGLPADIGLRVVEEVSGSAVEFTIITDMSAATQLLSPRNYMNNGATAAAVAYDCAGVCLETDY